MRTHPPGVEVQLADPSNSFLIIVETLQRVGLADLKNKIMHQVAHLLHRRGRYFVVLSKEMIAYNKGIEAELAVEDIAQRDAIIAALHQWKLIDAPTLDQTVSLAQANISVLSVSKKKDWQLTRDVTLGRP